jgi:2-polyprenyl-3-methyl-5-hydroxy-6-metoxy-1,4-benzoquinol methylase
VKVLLYPRSEPGQGMGHLRRAARLAAALGPEAALLLDREDARSREALRAMAAEPGPAPRVVHAWEPAEGWELVVLDRRGSSLDELARFLPVPVVGLDEGGEARPYVSFLVDCLPVPRGRGRRGGPGGRGGSANLTGPLLEAPVGAGAERGGAHPPQGPRSSPFRKLLISFGGEDPAGLSLRLLEALRRERLLDGAELTVVEGPFFGQRQWPPGVEVLRRPAELRELLHRYDLVMTSFGLTTFEALAVGVPVINLNPTAYHRRLSRAAGIPEIGVGRPRLPRLRRLMGSPELLRRPLVRYPAESFAGRSVGELLRGLMPSGPARCPACLEACNPAVARFPGRTFFRCRRCGLMYPLSFGGEEVSYDHEYFFGEYRRRYGRSYLEDFSAIRAMGERRLDVLERILAATRGPSDPVRGTSGEKGRLLDVGCAFGPFLAAARARGFEAHGVEVSAEAAAYVRRELGLPCSIGDVEDPSFWQGSGLGEGSFEAVTLWYVIEHLRRPSALLLRLNRLLRPGGVLAFSTPSASGVSGRRDLMAFLEASPEDHRTVWSPAVTGALLRSCGFRLRRIVVTGHHPERFPGARKVPPGSLRYRTLELLSRALGLGDTFEAYAEKVEDKS